MNKLIIFVGLNLFALGASAQSYSLQAWQEAVVKVRSYPCLTGRPLFEGSGLLVRRDQQIQVVTSEHVVIHSQSASFCHEVLTTQGEVVKVKLARFSFFSGLALLNLSENADLNAKALVVKDLPQSSGNNSGAQLTALGYPKSSTSVQVLRNGQLLSSQSQRALIPGSKYTIEAAQLPVEYGMSGGLLLAATQNNEYVLSGILSHQILKRNPAQGSSIENSDRLSQARDGDLAIAIPTGDVVQWLNQQGDLNPLHASLQWQRDPVAQLEGEEVVTYGPLRFSMSKASALDVFAIGGGRKTGGADGSGIGGKGNNPLAVHEELNTLDIRFTARADATLKDLDLKNEILNFWRLQQLRGVSVRVPFLRVASEVRLQEFHSLSEFFTSWFQKSYQPVALTSASLKNSEELSFAVKKLIYLSQDLREQELSVQRKAWLGLIRDQTILAQAGLLGSKQLEALSGEEHDEMWQAFYSEKFDEAVELSTALQNLSQIMKRLGI